MGKVGSKSLELTLSEKYPGRVIHAHTYDQLTAHEQRMLNKRVSKQWPVYVICPVREPFSRHVSAFFQNFKRDTNHEHMDKNWTIEELKTLFLNNFPHNRSNEWFDKNFRPVFGIDVYAEPFDISRKWQIYKNGPVQVLVYRSDLDHDEQLSTISKFLDFELTDWIYDNQSDEKEYRTLYRKFREEVKLPGLYLTIMKTSRYFMHFWNSDEINQYAAKWEE